MRAGPLSTTIALVALLAACPKPKDDAPAPAPTGAISIAIPSPSPSLLAAVPSDASPSFAGLPERVAAIAVDPARASPLQKQDGPAATTYVVSIPGVRSAAVAVIHGRPDAWSFSIYADGVKPGDFGRLKDLAPTPGGGRRWVVLDGPLRGAELFLSPNDASLVVLQSATFRDAAE